MAGNLVDLKKLINLIYNEKDFEANLILDEGCTLEVEDPKSLIKVINYLINYLRQLTAQPLEIGLDLRGTDILLSFMAYSEKTDLPSISEELQNVLTSFKAKMDKVHEPGKYIQLKVTFNRLT